MWKFAVSRWPGAVSLVAAIVLLAGPAAAQQPRAPDSGFTDSDAALG